MSRCLREEALWLLAEGRGTEKERAHLGECDACTRRYRRLADDLARLGRIIRDGPPPSLRVHPRRARGIRWVPAALVAAAVLAVVWGGLWLREPLRFAWSVFSAETLDEGEVRFLKEEVFPAVFATAGISLGRLPPEAPDEAYLQAALDGGWPCERHGRTTGCGAELLSLLLEGHGG